VVQLQIDGAERPFAVLVRELQRHPLTRNITHVDLLSIDLDQPVEVSVPINPIGVPVGVKTQGGNLEWQRRELQLRVLPTKIPEQIDVDVSGLELNDALHIEDVQVEGAELLEEPQLTICSVKTTRMSIAEPTEEGEEPAEGEEGATDEEAAADGDAEAADGDTES
jgi:large subunit ribosomal protein L25